MASKIERVERVASVSEKQARQELRKAFPGSKILSFRRVGNTYVASIRVAEMEAPKPKGAPIGDEAPLDLTDDGMDAGADDLDLDGDGDLDLDGDGDAEDKEDKIMDMLNKIMDHLGINGEGDDLEMKDEAEGLDLPDIGAPAAGEPMGGAPMGGGLPAPAPKPGGSSPMGGGAFSHTLQRKVGSRRSFTARRADASDVSNRQIINEAVAGFPGYRVAKLSRQHDGTVLVAMVAQH